MAIQTLESTGTPAGKASSGKYLTFVLGREFYGLAVLKIREIIRMLDITAVPQMPDYVRGVINLRGKVIPVVDLRIKFRLSQAATTERTCIIVVQATGASGTPSLMGLVVDAVEEVVTLAPGDIEPTPDFGTNVKTEYILGMAKVKGTVKTLLDIDRVVAADAIAHIHQTAAAA